MNIRPIGAEFHADGRTDRQADGQSDMTMLIAAFCNFAKAPNENAASFGHFRPTSSLLTYVLLSMLLST